MSPKEEKYLAIGAVALAVGAPVALFLVAKYGWSTAPGGAPPGADPTQPGPATTDPGGGGLPDQSTPLPVAPAAGIGVVGQWYSRGRTLVLPGGRIWPGPNHTPIGRTRRSFVNR